MSRERRSPNLSSVVAMDGVHDMGGMHGFERVVVPGGEKVFHAGWEPRVFALHILVGIEGLGAGPDREEAA